MTLMRAIHNSVVQDSSTVHYCPRHIIFSTMHVTIHIESCLCLPVECSPLSPEGNICVLSLAVKCFSAHRLVASAVSVLSKLYRVCFLRDILFAETSCLLLLKTTQSGESEPEQ